MIDSIETTYRPEIELCRDEKVHNRPGNYVHDTNTEGESTTRSPLKKQVEPSFSHELPQNRRKQTFLDATFKRLMKQKGRKLLRELLMYIDIFKANIYSKSPSKETLK
ncbi:uncharacterized protein LOC133204171 [Saccostrea echinata]|uniref:uncharacterized protein LOC133204171 n=1 Tax=Saccostrea echinata TaxID=191078 RepID=UPI002A80B304|nr:uncharacterized protein LOC133204171 [Saccostrea echinata]